MSVDYSSEYDPHSEAPGVYCPTPREIAAECLRIQRGWTKLEERRRRGFRLPVEFPVVSIYIEKQESEE